MAINPLKLADINHPNSTNILNKWADNQNQTLENTSRQIATLRTQVKTLQSSTTTSNSSTASSSGGATVSDETANRTFGLTYSNDGNARFVSGHANCVTGSGTASLTAYIGEATPTLKVWAMEYTATVAGAPAGFFFVVPPGYKYLIHNDGDTAGTPGCWVETTLS